MPGKPDPLTRPVGAVRTLQNSPYRTQGLALSEPVSNRGSSNVVSVDKDKTNRLFDSHARAPEIVSYHFTESIDDIIIPRRAAVSSEYSTRLATATKSTRGGRDVNIRRNIINPRR